MIGGVGLPIYSIVHWFRFFTA